MLELQLSASKLTFKIVNVIEGSELSTQADSAKDLVTVIDNQLAQSEAVMYTDYETCLNHAQAALAHSQKSGDIHRYTQAIRYVAWAHASLNRFETSLVYAMEGLMLARDFGLMETEAYLVNVIAVNFARCGIMNEAIHLLEYQLSLGERLQDDMIQIFALNDLGILKGVTGDPQAAVELLRRVVAVMPTHDIRYYTAHSSLASHYLMLGELDEATQHAEYVLQNAPFPYIALRARLSMIRICLARGAVEEARQHLDTFYSIPEDLMPVYAEYSALIVTSEVLFAEGRKHEAAEHLEHAYTMMIETNLLGEAITILRTLKTYYEDMTDNDKLISVYKRLADDIPKSQQQSSELRMTVLRMIFANDKAAMAAELNLNQQKSAILKRLSHEFRTPLAIIHSAAETLDRYSDKLTIEQRQQRLHRITSQVQRATIMLDDILRLLELDSTPDALIVPATFYAQDLVESAMERASQYEVFDRSRVLLPLNSRKTKLKAPREALEIILTHLLTNALKFSSGPVRLDVTCGEHTLVIKVTDQGIGIPLNEQKEIFKPLFRGSNLDEIAGNGIGMALVGQLVEQLDGCVHVESGESVGTVVTVRVPITITL